MKTQKLIPLLDYVLEQKQSVSSDEKTFINQELLSIERIRNYAKLLSQPLKLSMFVPCYEEGKILEEPRKHFGETYTPREETHTYFVKYKKSKENVLFEGFYVGNYYQTEKALYNKHSNTIIPLPFKDYKRTEDLIVFSLTLTENAVKLIERIEYGM